MSWGNVRGFVNSLIARGMETYDMNAGPAKDEENSGSGEPSTKATKGAREASRFNQINQINQDAEADSPLYLDSHFAGEWYKMRERGEHDRAAALSILYQRRKEPGGPYPDPRLPAAFSNRAALGALARLKGVSIWPAPEGSQGHQQGHHQSHQGNGKPTREKGLNSVSVEPVWLIIYSDPKERGARREAPNIAVTQQSEEDLMLWYVALMFGFITREPWRVSDPHVPAGVTTLPQDPAVRALLHRYAHALLLMDFDCSQTFGCACAKIEARLNEPPGDHQQPTMTIPAQRVTPIITQEIKAPERRDSPKRNPKSTCDR